MRERGPAHLFEGHHSSLGGCGGSSADGESGGVDGECVIEVALSGAVDATQSGRPEVACVIPHGFDSGVGLVFLPANDISSISLDVEAVTEGETGAAFVASVDFMVDDLQWSTPRAACTVDVDERSFEETEASEIGELRHYRFRGTGTCSEPALAASEEVEGEVTIGPFRFAGSAIWRG